MKQHRGRVIDSPGDNILSEFASVVDAVQCAVAVQKELQDRNAQLPENGKMQFRIGVNLGDVIEEESRIYGDGVNIAARLESLADPGGICVSKTAFDHIESETATRLRIPWRAAGQEHRQAGGSVKVLHGIEGDARKGAGFRGQGSGRRKDSRLSTTLAVDGGCGVWLAFRRTCGSSASVPAEKADRADGTAAAGCSVDRGAALRWHRRDPKTELLSEGMTESVIGALSKVRS